MQPENKYRGIKRCRLDGVLSSNCTDNPNTCQNCEKWKNQYEAKFDQLTESVNKLKTTIEELTSTGVQQNKVIMETLATQEIFTEKLLDRENYEASVRKIFPIQTADDLTEIDSKIIEENRAVYIRCMSSLLKGQLHKCLTEIFSVDLIIASNIDGIHGKLPLKNFKKIFDALMEAIHDKGEENPEKAIRDALKLIKKRHFQAICINKKKDSEVNHVEMALSDNMSLEP